MLQGSPGYLGTEKNYTASLHLDNLDLNRWFGHVQLFNLHFLISWLSETKITPRPVSEKTIDFVTFWVPNRHVSLKKTKNLPEASQSEANGTSYMFCLPESVCQKSHLVTQSPLQKAPSILFGAALKKSRYRHRSAKDFGTCGVSSSFQVSWAFGLCLADFHGIC